MSALRRRPLAILVFAVVGFCLSADIWAASNDVLGEVSLKPAGKIEKTAGIWVDGQYLGYLKELKGSKKILLLPGRHEITARLSGHLDFDTTVEVKAGERKIVHVAMRENPDAHLPDPRDMAKVKVLVKPKRAAVFVNERYVGNVSQFRGIGDFLGLNPGTYRIHITLPGYEPFETEMILAKAQKYEIKAKLRRGDSGRDDALMIRTKESAPPEPVARAQQ
jgi:hypothetical protein